MKKNLLCAWSAAVIWGVAGVQSVRAEDAILPLVPGKAEVLVSLNVRKLAATPVMQQILKEEQCEKLRNRLEGFATLTGIHPARDLERVVFFGTADTDKHSAVAIQGKLDEDRLVNLLKLNESYEASESHGITVHRWRDQKEKKNKHAAFFPNGVVVVANSPESMEAVLEARANPQTALLSSGGKMQSYIPAGSEELTLWAVMPRSGRKSKLERPLATFGVEALSAVADVRDGDVVATATAHMASAEKAAGMQQVLEGVLAAGLLQEEKPLVKAAMREARALPAQGNQASVEASYDTDGILAGLTIVFCRK